MDKERHILDKMYLETATLAWNGNLVEGLTNIQVISFVHCSGAGLQCFFYNPGSGMNISDHISESLVTIFGLIILKFFVNRVLGIRIRDPG
jgi:hypothetical protein